MRRLGMIVALGAMLGMSAGVLTASPALAGRGPKWESLPAEPSTLPSSFCGFAVQVTPVSKQFAKVLKTPDGSETDLITGTLTLSYTNLSTGKTITENASASARFTANADGSVTVATRGHSPLFLSPADAQRFGLPTVSVVAGALTLSMDPDGNLASLSLNGHALVDVCAALSQELPGIGHLIDCMIAAVEWRNQAALLACNADLERVARVISIDLDQQRAPIGAQGCEEMMLSLVACIEMSPGTCDAFAILVTCISQSSVKGVSDPILMTASASQLRTSLLAGDAVQIQFAMLSLWIRLRDCGQSETGWPRLPKRWRSWWRSVSYSLLLPRWM